jgi:hypothetical protein
MYPVRISTGLLVILTETFRWCSRYLLAKCLLIRHSRLYLSLYSHPIWCSVTCAVDVTLLNIPRHWIHSTVSCLINTQHKMLLCWLLSKLPCTVCPMIEHRTFRVAHGSWCSRLMKSSRYMTDQLSIILQSWLIKVCCVIHHREGKKVLKTRLW